MTKITLKKDTVFGFGEIKTSGHSGYSECGSDIICSYISSSCELVMSILIDALGADTETNINPEKALFEFKVLPTDKNKSLADSISAVTNGFMLQMKNFSDEFPKFVSITFA